MEESPPPLPLEEPSPLLLPPPLECEPEPPLEPLEEPPLLLPPPLECELEPPLEPLEEPPLLLPPPLEWEPEPPLLKPLPPNLTSAFEELTKNAQSIDDNKIFLIKIPLI